MSAGARRDPTEATTGRVQAEESGTGVGCENSCVRRDVQGLVRGQKASESTEYAKAAVCVHLRRYRVYEGATWDQKTSSQIFT